VNWSKRIKDAATGRAAGPLAGFLVLNDLIESNTAYQILQGVKLNQPSTIEVMVRDNGILVGGTSVVTMKGEVHL
jgi:predicted PhzF superfamily epimerase YddE/YHI9